MCDLSDGLAQMLSGEEIVSDDTSAPIALIVKCFDVGKVGSMLHVMISCRFSDGNKIAVLARHFVDDILVLLDFI